MNGHFETVKALLNDSRVDPSAQDNYGKILNDMMCITNKTAIKWALKNGHAEAMKVLLNDFRVDPSIQDNKGKNFE